MPVQREVLSLSVFAEEMGIDPRRLRGVEVNLLHSSVTLVLEPETDMNTSGTFPALTKPGTKIGKKGGKGKRG